MTREEILNTALQIHSNNICLTLSTGVGKTKVALSILKERFKETLIYGILIVVPKNVLKDEWIKEIHKWGMDGMLPHITFTTYVSFPKHSLTHYNAVIYDEAHHLTERCFESIRTYDIKHCYNQVNLFLSATISKSKMISIRSNFHNVYTLKVDIKEAIDNDILPDPEVLLLPLRLDKTVPNQVYTKRKSCKKIVECDFNNRWQYIKDRTAQVRIHCTQYDYYQLLEGDYTTATNQCREAWKRQLAIQRLKWLSEIKTHLVKNLLIILGDERTLTFCNSIEQCEELGKYPVHSGKKELKENLDKFNSGEINHITSVRMLDEGMNAVNLRVGIYANINASEVITAQRCGRVLRHEKPVLIIPYYQETREEEIVEKIKGNFNPEKIHIINYLNEIKNYLK